MHHSDVELKAHNVAQRSWESAPILNGEQPKAVKDSEVALNDPECVTRAHPTTALSKVEKGVGGGYPNEFLQTASKQDVN